MAETVKAPAVTHLIVTHEPDDSFSVESPQLPGFVMGRGTATELKRDLERVLRDLDVAGPLIFHQQVRGETAEGEEFVFRVKQGADVDERREVMDRVRMILGTEDRHDMMTMTPGPTGEIVFAAALANDTLGDLIDQMYPERDAIVICSPVIDRGVWSMAFYSGDLDDFDEPVQTIEESGWDRDTKISQVVRETASGRHRLRVTC